MSSRRCAHNASIARRLGRARRSSTPARAGCPTSCGRPCTTTTRKRRWRASRRRSPRSRSVARAKQPDALKNSPCFSIGGPCRFGTLQDARRRGCEAWGCRMCLRSCRSFRYPRFALKFVTEKGQPKRDGSEVLPGDPAAVASQPEGVGPMTITETAAKFFEACETGKGWDGCKAYCKPGATFAAQAEPLADVRTLQQYTDWMKGILTFIPDGRYALKSFATDAERKSVCAYGVFSGT